MKDVISYGDIDWHISYDEDGLQYVSLYNGGPDLTDFLSKPIYDALVDILEDNIMYEAIGRREEAKEALWDE